MGVRGFTKKMKKYVVQTQLNAITNLDLDLSATQLKQIKQVLDSSLTSAIESEVKKPKRKPSAYNMFMKEMQEKYKHIGDMGERFKKIGEEWKKLTDVQKKVYADKANKITIGGTNKTKTTLKKSASKQSVSKRSVSKRGVSKRGVSKVKTVQ